MMKSAFTAYVCMCVCVGINVVTYNVRHISTTSHGVFGCVSKIKHTIIIKSKK